MFNISNLFYEYCDKNNEIWNHKLNTFGACFLFTCIENPVFIVISIIFSYIIGSFNFTNELDQIIQNRSFSKKFFYFLEILCLVLIITFYILDYLTNYYFLFGYDYNGTINLSIKIFTICVILYFKYKSYQYVNPSLFCLIVSNISFVLVIIISIIQFNWTYSQFKNKTYFNFKLVFIYLNLVLTFIYFTLINFAFFLQKSHSLCYKNFANYTLSQPDIENVIDLEEKKSFLSKLTFNWVTYYLIKQNDNQTQINKEVFQLPFNLLSSVNYEKVNNIKNLLNINNDNNVKFWECLWKCYKKELFLVSYLKLIADFFSFFTPFFLEKIIIYIDSKKISFEGFYFVLFLLITSTISSVSINLYDFYINNIGIKLRSSVLQFIYQKLFSLRSQILFDNYSDGQIINFFSIDSERISNFCMNTLQLLSLPLQIIITLLLLYRQLGLSMLTILIFSSLLIPINKFITHKINKITLQILTLKDERIKITSELITGIKTIKMNCWDIIYYDLITNIRNKEIKLLQKKAYLDAICVYLWASTPVIISFITFSTYVILGNELTSSKVFSSLTLLNMLINPLNSFSWVIQGFFQSWISLKRIEKFLNLKDYDYVSTTLNKFSKDLEMKDNVIIFNNAVFHQKIFHDNSHFILGPINLEIKRGQFIGVIGSIGSGKTSFLKAILGEINQINKNGIFKIANFIEGVGYLSQKPWIQNKSIKDNILFGKSINYKFYNQVIESCDLQNDFKFFENNDDTIIGEKGSNLSGGQKSRIALARAIYQNFDIYLIDDIFSSLDKNVANHIYENCILKLLKNKTCILCTHQLEYLNNADLIIQLENGCVVQAGKPEKILIKKKLSETSYSNIELIKNNNYFGKNNHSNFYKEEINEGSVKLNTYTVYFKSIGLKLFFLIILFILLMQFSKVLSDYWLSFWIQILKINVKIDNLYYLKIFLLITILNSIIVVLRSFSFAYGAILTAKNMHEKLLNCILKMNLNFFNMRSFGQLINRFSSDIFHIDDNLPFTLNIFLACFAGMFASILVTGFTAPIILILFILLIYPYYIVQKYYRYTSTKLKRIISNTLSPIYSQFSETLDGLTIIKSFQAIKKFVSIFQEKVDLNNSAQYTLKACNQWLNLRLQFIGILVSSSIAFLAVLYHYFNFTYQTSLIGLALTYSFNITPILNSLINTFAQIEIDMISVERIQQYLMNEDKEDLNGFELDNFPKVTSIKFENVFFSYNKHSNLALNSISFIIHPKEFIGIVGRTGAGKSTIFSCLFRIYEIDEGNIFIDRENIKNLNIKTLRKSMYIIPQDVFLFDGTIRKNLDPFEKKTDSEIWLAIKECNAKSFILKLGGLNAKISNQSSNLSCGEKQIISLIRAFLCKVKILCLDEATSSIGIETENSLYKIIRSAFFHSTILMIAHKPLSVVNCDKIMVINEGKLLEMDTPKKLISDYKSYFYKICHSQDDQN